ncbi:MAG TPA: MotA/TolQ/ExbB proton channel family protein [Candidatus Cloacimonadota bacterium]|nr:MotA/TolQ/ExbB proton channel family protein [Candidatus Cloacimonadota bacterium]HOH78161.1 MotA/TolQ/ExbB proton channel family protein [Candidatus Cloacimonadota bacterium]HPH61841.1 MotA/TolQ/ExbB proton channel family protein [Candidatus Syntrophosphaera sp.]HPN40169.1 MotA/TolQ/ExbB proton channel family protein [Candidatus Cloacimonadota bacterium]
MTVFSLFLRGGILMYVLLLLSVAVIAIVIEKYRLLRSVRNSNRKIQSSLHQQDKLDNVRAILRVYGSNSPLGAMLNKLYNSNSKDIALIKESMESTANHELHKLERGMGWLSTFAAIAPLIGFLGTVIGMVRVFMNIQGQSQNGIDINILAGGIWEALLTTIGGLVVGIVAIILYNDLVVNLENIAKEMQEQAIEYVIRYQKTEE